MKGPYWLCFYILFFFQVILQSRGNRIWNRIPIGRTNEQIYDFIIKQKLDNCFEFYENSEHLRLKCWVDNNLVDIQIRIRKTIYI